MMIVAETTSIVLRAIIGGISAWRLVQYQKRDLLRCGEIKTLFHFAMLLSLFFSLPYFLSCDVEYQDSYCYVSDEKSFEYKVNTTLYPVYRLGLCLQVFCLSLTVLNWADFLHGGRYIGELCYTANQNNPCHACGQLRCGLLLVNLGYFAMSLALTVITVANPSKLSGPDSGVTGGGHNNNGQVVALQWMVSSAVQLVLVLLLLLYGCRLLDRIKRAVVFDNRNQRAMVNRLNTVLVVMVVVLVVEIAARWVMAMPSYVSNWENVHPKPRAFMLLSQNPILWQLAAYILPCDVLSFAMLYLMRNPPRHNAGYNPRHNKNTSTHSWLSSSSHHYSTSLPSSSSHHPGGGGEFLHKTLLEPTDEYGDDDDLACIGSGDRQGRTGGSSGGGGDGTKSTQPGSSLPASPQQPPASLFMHRDSGGDDAFAGGSYGFGANSATAATARQDQQPQVTTTTTTQLQGAQGQQESSGVVADVWHSAHNGDNGTHDHDDGENNGGCAGGIV